MSPCASWLLIWLSALPWTSSWSESSSGTIAIDAGPKKASAVPKMADMTTSCQSLRSPLAIRTATIPTARPRTESEVGIARRRGTRSTTTPPRIAKQTAGTARAAKT